MLRKISKFAKRKLGLSNLNWTKFPLVIQVDTNNHCGPKYCGVLCEYCFPQWQITQRKRSPAEMPLHWMKWILQEINRDGRTLSFIDWFLNGDALAEPRLPAILRMSKKLCPWLKTQTFTCGTLTKNADLLLDPNLDSICFTISAHNRELYKKVHRGDKFEDVLRTLEGVLKNRLPHQNVEVHCVLTKHNIMYAEDWWEFFAHYDGLVRVLSPLVASYGNLPSAEALGNLTLQKQEDVIIKVAGEKGRMWTRSLIPDRKPCVLWDNMSVDVSGAILQCCNWSPYNDWNYGFIEEYMEIGRRLKDAWTERVANRMRNKMCSSCNMKHPNWRARLDSMKLVVNG